MPKTKKTKRSGAVVYLGDAPSDDSDFDIDDLPKPAGKKVSKAKKVDFIDLSLSSPETETRETRSKKKEKEVKMSHVFINKNVFKV